MPKYIGIDVGGANLKWADDRGKGEIIYFPMWKNLHHLENKLIEIREKTKPEAVGAVITAELSDAFKNKSAGVRFISDLLRKVFDEVYFLSVDGKLSTSIDDPLKFAASNWVASVLFLSREYDEFLFVDMGSTTTDLIPFKQEILAAKTDFERVMRGELVYLGALRTPVCCLGEYKGYRLAAELFAIVADAFLLTDDIEKEDYSVETPDGRGKSRKECMTRLARMLCGDLDEVGEKAILEFARWIRERMIKEVREAIERQLKKYGLERVIGCGVGEFLIREAVGEAEHLKYISLREKYGEASDLFPSFAMANLVKTA
ncbi:MAG: H4MPT-linked C1 transfer pathway protein [Archaeoglobus sp.]|nr:H4MPT-linked C1 transfer pathway protein [Archaeoglobus sp.]